MGDVLFVRTRLLTGEHYVQLSQLQFHTTFKVFLCLVVYF